MGGDRGTEAEGNKRRSGSQGREAGRDGIWDRHDAEAGEEGNGEDIGTGERRVVGWRQNRIENGEIGTADMGMQGTGSHGTAGQTRRGKGSGPGGG